MAKDVRRGLNGTLAYHDYQGKMHTYRVRVNNYVHSYTQIAAEGANARLSRAYYPHRVTIDRFAIGVQLKGHVEYESLMVWMTTYARNLNDATMNSQGVSPVMSVFLAGRGFSRRGIPVQGYGFGDKVGKILWEPQIVFEAANDPFEQNPDLVTFSQFSDTKAVLADKVNAPYFYPFSQFASGTKDSGLYDQIAQADTGDANYLGNDSVQQAIGASNNGSGGPSSTATSADASDVSVSPTTGSGAASSSSSWGN